MKPYIIFAFISFNPLIVPFMNTYLDPRVSQKTSEFP